MTNWKEKIGSVFIELHLSNARTSEALEKVVEAVQCELDAIDANYSLGGGGYEEIWDSGVAAGLAEARERLK